MKRFLFFLLFISGFSYTVQAQISAVDPKGTRISIDSSKWTISGSNIYNKNSGNVGVGNTTPTYKLDVTGKVRITDSLLVNSARVQSLPSGTLNDSLVVSDPTTGLLKRVASTRLNQTANNGLTKTADSVQLGGSLTKATTITTTATNTLSLAGLQSGTSSDSILVANASTGVLRRISSNRISGTANNGLTKTVDSVQLGGSLTKATTITTTATNTLSLAGLQSGTLSDSILVANATTGAVRRISSNRISGLANNGLTKTADSFQLGGALTKATTIATSAANTLAITGLQTGSDADSLVAWDPATGILKKVQQHPPIYIKTTTAQTTSSTSLVDVNTLQFNCVAGYNYSVKVWLIYNSSSTANGIKLALNSFSGGNIYYQLSANQSGTSSQIIMGANSTDVLNSTGSRVTTNNLALLTLNIECTSNALFSFRFGSERTGSDFISIQPGSRLQYQIED